MHSQSLAPWQHRHLYLGDKHERHERRTWIVVALTAAMMVVEIIGGHLYGSMALVADGWHMSTHAAALAIAALAYRFARRHADDRRFSFGTGKFGELAGFSSAIVLGVIALLIAYESAERLFAPVVISYAEAIPIAVVGLLVNLATAVLLYDQDHHGHGHHHGHDHGHDREHAAGHHDHGHAHAGDHHHDHDDHDHDDHDHDAHDHDAHATSGEAHTRHQADRRDHNLRAAYYHVLADAMTSVLAIAALLAGRFYGWTFMDPLMGVVGAVVIASWSVGLMRSAGGVLVDMVPDDSFARAVRERLEIGGDRVADLHLWRLGPGHVALIAAVVSDRPQPPNAYKARLEGLDGLSHLTIEVHPCRDHAEAA